MSYRSFFTLAPVMLESVTEKSDSQGASKTLRRSRFSNGSVKDDSTLAVADSIDGSSDIVHSSLSYEVTIDTSLEKMRHDPPPPRSLFDPMSSIPTHLDRNYFDFPFFTDRKTFHYLNASDSKVMFVMRGLSGSGKSTIVNLIRLVYRNVVVCSADDYFLTPEGEYKFDEKLLSTAHGECQQKAKLACKNKVSVVVIDNTNVRKWEMTFYANLANTSGYVAVPVQPKTPWRWNAQELAARNKHGVPAEVLQAKIGKFDDVIPAYYAWFLNERKSKCLTNLCSHVFTECLSKFPEFKRDLLKELQIRPEHIDEETAAGILSEYYSQQGKKSPLLHCTAKFCARGKAPGAKEYHQRAKVQKSCGQLFNLNITGFVITKRTLGARVSFDPSATDLFNRPEEREWDAGMLNGKSPKFTAENRDDGIDDGKSRRGKKKKKKIAVESKKKQQKSKRASQEKENHADGGAGGDETNRFSDTSGSQAMGVNGDDAENVGGSHQEKDVEPSSNNVPLSDMFPCLINSGFARSAHVTIKTARGVESREVNFDILKACDVETSHIFDKSELVPVLRGQACYFGDGLCCIYFDKPLHAKTLFSGYY